MTINLRERQILDGVECLMKPIKVKVHPLVGVSADEGSQHVFSGRESRSTWLCFIMMVDCSSRSLVT